MTYGELSSILVAAETLESLMDRSGPKPMFIGSEADRPKMIKAITTIIDNARAIRLSEVPVVPLQR